MRSNEVEERIRRIIRDSVTLDPLISLRQVQDVLKRKGIQVGSLHYIAKLRKKVHGEALAEVDHAKINAEISSVREEYRMAIAELKKIAYWTADPTNPMMPPAYKDKIAAFRQIATMKKALLEMQMDAGVYKRQLGVVEHRHTLPAEHFALVIKAMQAWGLTPGQKVPAFSPLKATPIPAKVVEVIPAPAPKQEHGNSNTNTNPAPITVSTVVAA